MILRHRAARRRAGGGDFVREQLSDTDRNGKLAKPVAGIDRTAELPLYFGKTASDRLKKAGRARSCRAGFRPAQGGDLCHVFR